MKFGFIPTEGGASYCEALEEVLLAEELGFYSVWMEEHHGVKNHYWPSPLMVLAGFATRTERIVLGTDILVLPFYHPTHVAEGAAMLDVMSRGRAILGVAIGYRQEEFALFGTRMDHRGARFEEQMEIIRRLWTADDVTFEGKFFHLREASIEPKPMHPGGLPLWIGGWGPLSLKRAARYADAWIPGPTADLGKLTTAKALYHGELRALGKRPEAVPAPLTRDVVIAETEQLARELAERHLLVSYRDEYGGGWKHPLIGHKDSPRVDQLDEIGRDRFIIGNPEQCVRKIQRFQDSVGVDQLICRLYFPGMPHEQVLNELRLLAREVFPAFR
jgi:probable F420-dependent oxidoreductase